MSPDTTDIRDTVREKYGKIAEGSGEGTGCCGSTKDSPCCGASSDVVLQELGYTREQVAAVLDFVAQSRRSVPVKVCQAIFD